MSSIYVLGDLNLDVLMQVDRFPREGEDVRSEQMVLAAGGSAANSACALARLGHEVQLLAAIGDDPFAEIAMAQLASMQVQLEHVRPVANQSTGLMFVPVTPNGERTLFGRRGANRAYKPEWLPLDSIGSADGIHLSGYALLEGPQSESCAKLIEAASRAGLTVSMDTAYEPPLARPEAFLPLLPMIDLLILGEREAMALADSTNPIEALDRLHAYGVPLIALKRGGEGSLMSVPGENWPIPAFTVASVDTTGAGDGYSGALLCGRLWNLSHLASGLLASATAALITTGWGAAPSTPSIAQVLELLQQSSVRNGLEAARLEAAQALESRL